jgi:predicted  nucleic acid-binding Zn-ribbon protein
MAPALPAFIELLTLSMKEIIETLLELQKLQLSIEPLSLAAEAQTNELRLQVPKPILDHFDRLIAHGKAGVAVARNGVCCGCQLRICSGTFAILTHQTDICICNHCGRYLYLPRSGVEIVAEKLSKKRGRGSNGAGRCLRWMTDFALPDISAYTTGTVD